jgi:tetratricopeptide (TPR) repeat protein
MFSRILKGFVIQLLLLLFLLPLRSSFAMPPQVPGAPDPSTAFGDTEMAYGSANAEIHINGPNGLPIKEPVVVTLSRVGGQMYGQNTAKEGFVKFERVPYSEFTVQVIAPGYKAASKEFEVNGPGAVSVMLSLQPLEAEEAAESRGFYALPRNVQKDVGKALDALRANKPNNAIKPLEAARRGAPNSAEVEYLFSLYSTETKDPVQARAHWMKTLELDPRHLSTLLAVGEDDLQSDKSAEALPYLKRAVEVEPASWRAQTLLSEAYVLQKMNDEATQHALRAIELGHERASAAQLVLVRALVQKGEVPQAISKLEEYVKAHPEDKDTANYLEKLKHPPAGADPGASAGAMSVVSNDEDALPVPSNWLPPDVDSSVPAVEPGVACNVDDAVRKAGQQLVELAKDVDRFTATETLTHQSIDKYGLASAPEKRTFSYVASIEEVNQRFLNVEEYRLDKDGGPAQFPGGVATNGLPALVLIFHPFNAPDFTMTCEGLARLSTGLAWQVHFKQRPDKPNVIKRYRIGADGPSYPVALKGRAWISADKYQIVRLETDLVEPIKPIRLAADRAEIEYGPVEFAKGKVSMWLPKTADIYYDWKGQRIHRRHSFSDYMLFAIDDKQKISAPKVDDSTADSAPATPNKKP